ncbi:HNH endonuclease [Arthrobacter sp. MA-N2]|uniref:HNH endonuclease n=1 Tax=Arthrobacter sp. MA-N2 TaxID=1101188 RepID=UPI000486F137|nr:HNH endonuclease [Arthrobacter sp. MA-N2]
MPSMSLMCAICNLPMQKTKTSKPQGEAAHNQCRKANPVHGSHNAYKGGCRCEKCKAGQRERMADYNATKRQEQPIVTCGHCGEAMARSRGALVTLHRECKNKVPEWQRKGNPDPKIERARRRDQAQAERAHLASQPKRDLRSEIRAGYEDRNYERFIAGIQAKVVINDEGCWEWQGQLKRGYPIIKFKDKYLQVHRLVIEACEGKPLGVLAAHHACANSSCVNPDHLQPVTHRENTAEMITRNSLEARIAELEKAISEMAPTHPVLNRVSHLRVA